MWFTDRWRYQHSVLLLCMLAFFATMVARLAPSPLVPAITAEFGVSNAAIGAALTGMWLAYSITHFPSGILGDRYGERRIILIAIGGTAITSLFLALAPLFSLFVLGAVLLGAVAGLHYTVATTLLTRTFDDVGRPVGIHTAGGPLGGLVAPILAAWIGVRFGWRAGVAVGVVIAIPIFLLFAFRIRPIEPLNPTVSLRSRIQPGPLTELITRPSIAFTIFIAFLGTFVWQATASFLPTFLVEHRELTTVAAGTVFSMYFVLHGIFQVWVGGFSDRHGRDGTIGLCLVAAIAGFLALILGSEILSLIIGIVLIGFGMSMSAAFIPRFLDLFSKAERGTGFGLVRTVYLSFGATGPVVVGFIADLINWGMAFGILVIALGVILVGLVVNLVFKIGL